LARANQKPVSTWYHKISKNAEVLNVEKSGTKFDIIDKKTK